MTEGDEESGVSPVLSAAVLGDREQLLREIQRKLALELDKAVLGRDAAVISKELRAVSSELDQLVGGEGSQLDDLAARRAQRRTGTTGT